MPKDFCCFENVIGSGWIVFLFIYKELGGSASSSRGQHHPECLFGLRSGQVKERWGSRKIANAFFKLGTSSFGVKLSICVETEKKVLGMIRKSCVLCLGHLKVKRPSYKILDLPTRLGTVRRVSINAKRLLSV